MSPAVDQTFLQVDFILYADLLGRIAKSLSAGPQDALPGVLGVSRKSSRGIKYFFQAHKNLKKYNVTNSLKGTRKKFPTFIGADGDKQ